MPTIKRSRLRRTHDLTPEALAEARNLGLKWNWLQKVGLPRKFWASCSSIKRPRPEFAAADARTTLAKARDAAVKAARLEKVLSEYAYWALGMVQFTSREPDEAILSLRQGLEINPNCALLGHH